MSFLLYERFSSEGVRFLRPTGEDFSLAGYNLIYSAWVRRGRPTARGWHVTAGELIELQTCGQHDCRTRSLVIDFHPSAKWRIGLVELLDIYAYTYQATAPQESAWTPFMLRGRYIFYTEYKHDITVQKQQIISLLSEAVSDADVIEFLYLNGTDTGWNWGSSGRANAVFIEEEARTYFRQFF
ncbi:MAG: hypothetical protein K8T91_07230 [Planctomycetes bacterium]|nr:hypothetical protein [Planctomycetota bacterium]